MQLISHRFPAGTKELLLMPVGDIQWASDRSEVALGMLRRHIQWGVDHDAWFIGMGDYIDTFSPSNRERLSGAKLYDTAMKALDRDAKARVEEIYHEALESSRGRWLGLLEGHHYHEYRDKTTTDQQLAGLLEAPFIGSNAYIRLTFAADQSKKPHTSQLLIWAHHGEGSSVTVGGAINKVAKRIEGWEADIYLMGHYHRVGAQPVDRVFPVFPPNGKPHLVHRTAMLVTTGSFLKGFVVDRKEGEVPRGSYAEKGMMNPLHLGAPIIRVRPRWQNGIWLPDINAEV